MSTTAAAYLRYLPALYARDGDFLGRYLSIFQKILTGLDDDQLNGRKGIQQLLDAEIVGNLFYPRFSFLFPDDHSTFIPPISGAKDGGKALLGTFDSYIGVPVATRAVNTVTTPAPQPPDALSAFTTWLNDFLTWLGAMVDLTVDQGWSIDKRRTVIAQIIALYRLRGTAQGMEFLLNLLLDLPMTVNGTIIQNGKPVPMTGQVSVSVANPTPAAITVTDVAGTKTFIVRDSATEAMPLVAGYMPWCFQITITLPTQAMPDLILGNDAITAVQTLIGKVRHILATTSPATTQYHLRVTPGPCLNSQGTSTQLNVNALLGS